MAEAKTVLARLLAEFSFELESPSDLSVTTSLTTPPADPVKLRVERR